MHRKKHEKRHHAMFKKDEHKHENTEQVMKELFEESKKRRIILRKETGEEIVEIPLPVSVGLLIVGFLFFFPIMLIAAGIAYWAKMRMDVVRDLTDDEADLLDHLEHQEIAMSSQLDDDNQAAVATG